uniref:Uncharacterized protein n=1 Tax=Junco hyemalis TaxID=40217 RepID=A0A8C5IE87_JUNHY
MQSNRMEGGSSNMSTLPGCRLQVEHVRRNRETPLEFVESTVLVGHNRLCSCIWVKLSGPLISCLLLSIQMKHPWLGSKASEEDGKCLPSPLCVCAPLVTNN